MTIPRKAARVRRGFTLVELAIVLVIIGLIIGGVLVGRDMIKGAEIKSQIRQIDQIKSAVLVFRDKYNGLPGDMPNATQFFATTSNGDGNGLIISTLPPTMVVV